MEPNVEKSLDNDGTPAIEKPVAGRWVVKECNKKFGVIELTERQERIEVLQREAAYRRALEEVRERLRKIWLDPASLDPAQSSAKVTRDIAKRLAQVSLALEKKNYPAQDVAMFVMRCLFTMFA